MKNSTAILTIKTTSFPSNMNTKKNIRSITVFVYNEDGSFIGKWDSITEAAKANNVNTTNVSNGIWSETHFSVGRYWLRESDNIEDVVRYRKERLDRKRRIDRSYKEKTKIAKQELTLIDPLCIEPERKGDYIFIKTSLTGNNCCIRCSLASTDEGCLPCRVEDNHENGYWRYCKKTNY